MMTVACSGKRYQLGTTHGAALQGAVRANIAGFQSACRDLRLEWLALVRDARRASQDYPDSVIEEIGGVARGAGLDFAAVLAFNLCHGVVFPDECTVLFAMGDATASGNPLFLKNSDKIGSESMVGPDFYKHKEVNVAVIMRPDDGPHIVGVAAAGSTGLKMGVNENGVAVGANIVRTVELGKRQVDTTQMRAIDRAQLAREGLQYRSALAAAGYVTARVAANPMSTPGNLEFVDPTCGVIIEGSYDRVAVQVVRSGIASRANSFVILHDLNDPQDASSSCRYTRTQQLLTQNFGKLTPELMQRFSQDHANGPGPNSICRHGSHYSEETSQSGMVVEINRQEAGSSRFWIALGKPCHAWAHREGSIGGTMSDSDAAPKEFLNGQTWKRFWKEEPNLADSSSGLPKGEYA
jgi:hypothetical protein